MQTAPYTRLFDPNRMDASVWHGRPFGLHSFGHQQLFTADDTGRPAAADLVDTTTIGESSGDDRNCPSFCHCTVRGSIADAVNVWVENGSLARTDYCRTVSQWFPSHLQGTWEANAIRIDMGVTVLERDRAVIEARIRNRGTSAFAGTLRVQGDENRRNATAAWWDLNGGGEAPAPGVALVNKYIGLGMPPDVFIFFRQLAPDLQRFDWVYAYYRFAFALSGADWTPAQITTEDGYQTWAQSRPVQIDAGEEIKVTIGFAGEWCGRRKPAPDSEHNLIAAARSAAEIAFADAVAEARNFWTDFFASVPQPSDKWDPRTVDLYYKAWTCVYYNIWPASDFMLFSPNQAVLCCNKVSAGTFIYPATWEGSCGALLLSQCRPELAAQLLKSLYEATEEDGFLAEAPGNRRQTQLACIEPFVAWAVYRQLRDKSFLRRIFPALRRNLRYRFHFPNWRHLTAASCRNYTYCAISARYALRIALEIGEPTDVIRELESWVVGGFSAVDAFWDDERGYYRSHLNPNAPLGEQFADGTTGESLIPVFPGMHRPEYGERLLRLIRNHFLTDNDLIRRYPVGLPARGCYPADNASKQLDWTLKESNLTFVLYGIKKLDRDLFQRIVHGTLANIANVNDFRECYTSTGEGKHNGPGSIFGAFATIYSILLADDKIDEVFDVS